MDYITYLKKEIEKAIFVQIKKDITLNINESPVLSAGDYPILPKDVMYIAQNNTDSIPADVLIRGMIYLIACDKDFKLNDKYISFLKAFKGIESYIIMEIEKNKKDELKKSIIYASTLCIIKNTKENRMNRIYLLMEHLNRTGLAFLEEEILRSLEELKQKYPEYGPLNYNLGEYYLDKDMDLAKHYFRISLDDKKTHEMADKILEKIRVTEEYDKAVEMVKAGQGDEALKILIPYCSMCPDNLDAKYYTAVSYRQLKDNYNALFYLNELTTIAERPEVYNEIGLNLAELGEFEAAREYFKKALKIKPDDSSIICNIGVCDLNLGETAEAKKAFTLAARINPNDEVAINWLNELEEE